MGVEFPMQWSADMQKVLIAAMTPAQSRAVHLMSEKLLDPNMTHPAGRRNKQSIVRGEMRLIGTAGSIAVENLEEAQKIANENGWELMDEAMYSAFGKEYGVVRIDNSGLASLASEPIHRFPFEETLHKEGYKSAFNQLLEAGEKGSVVYLASAEKGQILLGLIRNGGRFGYRGPTTIEVTPAEENQLKQAGVVFRARFAVRVELPGDNPEENLTWENIDFQDE